jgi:acyl carrier protein
MNMLVKIISEQLCIPADEITPEKSFVDDLGV